MDGEELASVEGGEGSSGAGAGLCCDSTEEGSPATIPARKDGADCSEMN